MSPVKLQKGIIDYNYLSFLLSPYKKPRDKITDLLKKGDLIRVKKGLYITEIFKGHSYFPLANLIYGPSYLSKEMALYFYGLIPERVYEYTSMTTGKNKTFHTPVGRFGYQSIKLPYYSEGLKHITLDDEGYSCIIATKEKALTDLFYDKKFNGQEECEAYLDGLRIETEDLKTLNIKMIKKLSQMSQKNSIQLLCQILESKK